jgi:citrate lyase subunit beta/citryl-CoA lyase
MITNATGEGADAVILDLEDGCPMPEKETARVFARDSIPMLKEHGLDVFVRVNSLETGMTETDIRHVVVQGIDGIMLAKTQSKEDILQAERLMREEESKKNLVPESVAIMALIETPKGIMNIQEIIEASKRVIAVGFGAGDFSREMGAGMGVSKLSPEEYFPMVLYARSAMAVASRAAGIQAIDTPFFGLIIDLEGLKKESEKAKLLGFSGKQLTHPRHVDVVNQVFTPAKGDVDFAKGVVAAYEEARAKGLGATTMGGKMIDYGSFKRAESLLAFAKAIEEREKRFETD